MLFFDSFYRPDHLELRHLAPEAAKRALHFSEVPDFLS